MTNVGLNMGGWMHDHCHCAYLAFDMAEHVDPLGRHSARHGAICTDRQVAADDVTENVTIDLQSTLGNDPDLWPMIVRSLPIVDFPGIAATPKGKDDAGRGWTSDTTLVCVGASSISPEFSDVAIFKRSLHSAQTELSVSRTRQMQTRAQRYL